MHRSKLNRLKTFRSPDPTSIFSRESALSLTGSASRTDLSQLAIGIWEIHAGCPSFLRVSSVAKIGYIPKIKASNARDQDEVSSDLARMVRVLSVTFALVTCAKKTESGNCQRSRLFFGILSLEKAFEPGFWSEITNTDLLKAKIAAH